MIQVFCVCIGFLENRNPLFGPMLWRDNKGRVVDLQGMATPTLAMPPTNGPVLRAARTGSAWTGD